MKDNSTSRLQGKTNPKPHKTQPKTRAGKSNSGHPQFLALLETSGHKGGGCGADVSLTRKQIKAMERDASIKGWNLMDWLAQAVQTKANALTSEDFHLPAMAKHQSCLVLYDRDMQEPVCRIHLTEEENEKLLELRLSKMIRRLDTDIVAECLRRHLLNPPDPDKLQDAVYQVKALLIMLCDLLAKVPGGYGDGITCGIQQLIWSTEDHLKSAIEAATGMNFE